MLVLTHKLRPAVAAVLAHAVEEAERRQEIAITIRVAKDLASFARDVSIATLSVLDLHGVPAQQALTVAAAQLEEHPFAKIILVPTELPKLTDQLCLYHFGRVGIRHIPTLEEAQDQEWWLHTLSDTAGFDVVAQAQRDLRMLVTNNPRGLLAIKYAQHATVGSVKLLADRLYPNSGMTPSYKRRKLWQECKAVGAGAPENVLAAVRLTLMKTILDSNVWTPDRVARYFGYDNARNMNRSCKNRYKRSLRDIRRLPREDVLEFAKTIFFNTTANADS